MKKEINSTYVKDGDDISIILENGVIVAIIYHEYGHAINAVISFKENKLEFTGTPRKKYLKLKEGGYYLEMALFGKVIKNLSLSEALYILNENNYSKSLEEFREGFIKLSYQDLVIDGQFSNMNLGDESIIKNLDQSITIKAKKDEGRTDPLKSIKIRIPLRNDIIGRHITEEDLDFSI